ncbi:PEGA domain-containing protein, partial [Streptococcus suis]
STPYRSSFEAGSYTFTLTKDGFHTWTKTLRVVASEVTNAMGVVLVPLAPQANRLDTRSQIVAQSISRDHKRLLYVTSGLDAGIYTLDIGASK